MSLTVNGTSYSVNVVFDSLSRSSTLISGSNAGVMLDKSEYGDVIGTHLSYTFIIEPDPSNRASYDSLYEVLNTPANSITIAGLPYGQTTKTIVGRIISLTDKYKGAVGTTKRWRGLQVTIKSLTPYKTV